MPTSGAQLKSRLERTKVSPRPLDGSRPVEVTMCCCAQSTYSVLLNSCYECLLTAYGRTLPAGLGQYSRDLSLTPAVLMVVPRASAPPWYTKGQSGVSCGLKTSVTVCPTRSHTAQFISGSEVQRM